jgi:hypothetical protein
VCAASWKWNKKVEDQLKPTLIGGPQPRLVDYIVKQKLLSFYLKNGCIKVKDTEERRSILCSSGCPLQPN